MSLYHYTDVKAVQSILETRTIRLTDIRFLNDKEELREGLMVLEETLYNEIDGDFAYKEEAIAAIHSELVNEETSNNELNPLYVFSLSSAKDQLSQWRAYGSYAIEFEPDLLREHVNSLFSCIYEFNEKVRRSTSEVHKSVSLIAKEMEKHEGCVGPHGYDAMTHLMHDAATFKHDGFVEEKETRIIIPESDQYDIQYRPRDEMLIPYIEIKIPLDCIKSIQIGPMENQDLAYTSMMNFVRKIERNWQFETSNIEYWLDVQKSPIPYRA